MDIRCKKCNRYLNIKPQGTVVSEVRCPDSSCKHWNQIKITNADSSFADIAHKFVKPTTD